MKLKTKAWPYGRNWPDAVVLDVGSNMPHDVHGLADNGAGVRYVRHDKAKSLDATTRRVRQLEKLVASWRSIAEIFDKERKLMAMLAAETPQFYNPLDVMEAKKTRDLILKQLNDPDQR